MAHGNFTAQRVGSRQAKHAAAQHKDKLELAAKLGWATKGALYVTLGVLALMVAVGSGGKLAGSQGVIDWVAQQPFGTVLMALAGIGFSCYALWRLLQVIIDPEHHDSKTEMIFKRIGWGASGAVHAGLAVASFQAMNGGQGKNQRIWLSSVMEHSWGVVFVAALGLFVIGVGLYQFKKAVKLGFLEDVNTAAMSAKERKAIRFVGRLGHSARGVVFPIIGYYLLQAAWSANPGAAKGVGGALHELAQAGWYVLALIAFGLGAYGVLQLFFAKYRHLSLN